MIFKTIFKFKTFVNRNAVVLSLLKWRGVLIPGADMYDYMEEWLTNPKLEEFCSVLCENYDGWRWSNLSRFWRILGALVFGMFV